MHTQAVWSQVLCFNLYPQTNANVPWRQSGENSRSPPQEKANIHTKISTKYEGISP